MYRDGATSNRSRSWMVGNQNSFGSMRTFLEEDLQVPVRVFDYAGDGSGVPDRLSRRDLKTLSSHLASSILGFIKELGASQVDVVAHSMGGLLVRAWMAGLTDPEVPYSQEIRRLVLAGSPNFGVHNIPPPVLGCAETEEVRKAQRQQIIHGSQFLKGLNKRWEDKLRRDTDISGHNIMTIVGCGNSKESCLSDNIVLSSSATLPRTSPQDYVVRYVNKKHYKSGRPGAGMVDINSREHETYQLVKQFFGSEDGSIGPSIDADAEDGLAIAPLVGQSAQPFSKKKAVNFGKALNRFTACTDSTPPPSFRLSLLFTLPAAKHAQPLHCLPVKLGQRLGWIKTIFPKKLAA
ncbi:MAG: esterase/lipase family protein [Candidatus Binatia bacterium]